MPTNEELRELVVCSDGKYANLGLTDSGYICSSNENYTLTTTTPTINTTYFPDITDGYWFFWSSSPDANFSEGAWGVAFYGSLGNGSKDYLASHVRLVRE